MKKISFLVKLFNEGKLQLVDPSEEIKQSYLKKSESNLVSAKILLENNKLEESVSLVYYSMYHILTALLFKAGIKCENHSASIILLKELFSVDNSDIFFAKKERIDKQYYTDFNITNQEILEAIRIAENFNKRLLDFISKLDNQKIKEYREKFKILNWQKIK
ncbi:HEPN domain-containing protein [Candidatus Woesearchaeota archaeon]|nr:HEPN domain-containing protein [Candidatus Woesearchaeota archaeon]MBU3942319.1 HEPN domain-containing protein [Nanoarchaeota archaeon]